jgi:hypothetical protein
MPGLRGQLAPPLFAARAGVLAFALPAIDDPATCSVGVSLPQRCSVEFHLRVLARGGIQKGSRP